MKKRAAFYVFFILVILAHGESGGSNKVLASESLYDAKYYAQLRHKCESDPVMSAGKRCCLQSVKDMENGGFAEAINGRCRNGEKLNSLLCPSSYSWCEPSDKNVDKKG